MPTLKTVTFAYRTQEDRVLVAINLGQADAWACWLTRRLALAVLQQAGTFVASTSPLARRAEPSYRSEVVAFEQDAAMETTAKAVSPTPREALDGCAGSAELAVKLSITPKGERLWVELAGDRGGGASGLVPRADFQRLLRMLQVEVERAQWAVATPAAASAMQPGVPGPARH
jgi:hypothetical protein